MKKTKKMMIVFMVIILAVCTFASCFYEANAVMDIKANFTGSISGDGGAKDSITKITSTVLTAIRYVGSGVALIMLTYAFIRYMLSAASERAEIKKNLIPFIIGAVVLFAASNIITILQEVAKKAFVTT